MKSPYLAAGGVLVVLAALAAVWLARTHTVQHDAAPHLAAAQAHLGAGRIEHAFLEHQAYVELAPDDAAGWLGLAQTWATAGMAESAEGALTRALESGAERAPAHALRAALRERLGRDIGALHDAQAALAAGAEAAPLRAIVERAQARRAKAAAPPAPARRERFWPGALATLIQDVQRDLQRRDGGAAEQRALAADRTYPGTMLGPWLRGVIAYAQGRFGDAERHLLEALARAPRSSRVATNLAGAWAKLHGPLQAGERLLGLAARDPGFVVPLDIASTAFIEARQPARAEAALRSGIAAPGAPAAAYRYLASFYRQLDRTAEAVAVCNEGQAVHAQSFELARLCAELTRAAGDAPGAIELYEALLAREPDAAAAAALARLLLQQQRAAGRARAVELVRDAQHDAPAGADVLGDIGWTLLELGQVRAAKEWLAAAVAADPARPDLRYHRARALARLDEIAAARAELRAALESPLPFAERPDAQRLRKQIGR